MSHRQMAAELDAARRRYCAHVCAYCPDPMAVTWPRDLVCVDCGATVNPAGYVADPGSALRRRVDGGAQQ